MPQSLRAYQFYVCKGQLYAAYFDDVNHYETYQYNGFTFEYFGDMAMPDRAVRRISDYVVFQDTLFITYGYLYRSDDLCTLQAISMPNDAVVWDLEVIDGSLYVLCGRQTGKSNYSSILYKSTDGSTFDPMFRFNFSSPARSFCYDNGCFYFGTGAWEGDDNPTTGSILRVRYSI